MSKTATTWLQGQVFPSLLGRDFRDNPPCDFLDGGPWQGGLARAFRRSPDIWRREGARLLRALIGSGDVPSGGRRTMLISDQSAGPRLLEYGTYVGPHWEQERMDPALLRRHLELMRPVALDQGFSSLRVFIVVRRQDQWLASKYAQRSDRIAGASQQDFEDRVAYYLDPARGFHSDGVILDYDHLWNEMQSALGPENVLIVPYEHLGRDPADFLHRYAAFQGLREAARATIDELAGKVVSRRANVRSKATDVWELRRPRRRTLLEAPRPRGFLNAVTPRRSTIRMTGELRRRILETFHDSNSAVGSRIGFDLDALGYSPPE